MKKLLGLALIALFASTPVLAAGDAAAGKAKSALCATCHGANGIAVIPGYPNLKGQNAQYLELSLKAYKNKQRTSASAMIMQPMAMMLTDADMANLAAYYSTLK